MGPAPDLVGADHPAHDATGPAPGLAPAGRGSGLAHEEAERAVEQALALVGGSSRRPSLRWEAPGEGPDGGPGSDPGDLTAALPQDAAPADRTGSRVRSS
ncbi:molybdopterin molybdenumtransferase MoeA, partial [Streptomyces anulatus]|nr:molybdopterin molybdenumtransferase MoeA [Streptomyces anulatus]